MFVIVSVPVLIFLWIYIKSMKDAIKVSLVWYILTNIQMLFLHSIVYSIVY